MSSVAVTCSDENRPVVEAYHVSSNLIGSRLCCPVFVITEGSLLRACLLGGQCTVTKGPQPVLHPVFLLYSSSLSLKGLQFLLAQSEGLRAEDVPAVQLVKPPQAKQCLWFWVL